jgi:ABC-type multidrug transport system fused ATPase/permease subunit
LLASLRSLLNCLESSVQVIFYMAAYFEAVEVKRLMDTKGRRGILKGGEMDDVQVIDYETTRQGGGMRIEARDLGFAYPGTNKPVLQDVNLVIEPGTTLAIVGFNGGGEI